MIEVIFKRDFIVILLFTHPIHNDVQKITKVPVEVTEF